MGTDTNRDLKLDGLKFIMIFLVILGHLSYNDWGLSINRMIYSFHMPVFVFLSGYFTSPSTDREKQLKWLKKTLLIYLIAQLAYVVLDVGFDYAKALIKHESIDTSLLSWRDLIVPRIALWYLVCLIYWRLSAWRFFSKTNDIALLFISCGLALASGFVPIDEELSFQRAFSLFPFFVSGMLFRKHGLMERLNKLPYYYALIGLLLGLVASRFMPTYMPKFHYMNWHQLILRVIQTGLGLFLCLCILRVTQVSPAEKVAKYGIYTLWIYIGHIFLLKIGEKALSLFGLSLNLFTALLLASFYCLVLILLANSYHAKKVKL